MLKKVITNIKSKNTLISFRSSSTLPKIVKDNAVDRMQAWQIHSYDGINSIKLSDVRIPPILKPMDILIKVEATSVNPIDIAMTKGYGAKVLNVMRDIGRCDVFSRTITDLPLTLGRDFSGTIVSKGHGVGDKLKIGDSIWGVIPVEKQGCHAQFAVVDSNFVNIRPENLSSIEAASILYAGLTAWSALWWTGGLCYKTSIATRGHQRVLILGGSGGVGTLAIQLLKSWGAIVITTCSTDAVPLLEKLNPDIVIDYKEETADRDIIREGPYEIILDCCNQGPDQIREKKYPFDVYIGLNSPLLKNIDDDGFLFGGLKNMKTLLKSNVSLIQGQGAIRYGFFMPSKIGIDYLQELVESQKLQPVIQQIYNFQDLPEAYKKVCQGHLRGKVVIDMK